MPNQPREENRGRNIRVEAPLWDQAKRRAAERSETVSDAIRRFLQDYTR
jgi:macrodomain Ter protein organizer (MatP/YcbG family)